MKRVFRKIKAGFTLIEMLVVIVIIIVLAGLVFKMARPAGDAALKAQCLAELEIIKTLIEEYHAEFGCYPPASGEASYSYPDIGNVAMDRISETDMFSFGLFSYFVGRASLIEEFEGEAGRNNPSKYSQSLLTKFGRGGNSPLAKSWMNANDLIFSGDKVTDPDRVKKFADRVRPTLNRLANINSESGLWWVSQRQYHNGDSSDVYTNRCVMIFDPWYHQFVYISKKPYTSYIVFSPGPDGQYFEDNPGKRYTKAELKKLPASKQREAMKNDDNIYGYIGND